MLCKHDHRSSGHVVCIAQSRKLINACACACALVRTVRTVISNYFTMNIYRTVFLTVHGNNYIPVYRPALMGGRGKVYVGHWESVNLCPVTTVTAYDRQRPEPWSHTSEMRQALLACGVDKTVYSGHNFMIGAAINSTA